jgi:hypothetical protein
MVYNRNSFLLYKELRMMRTRLIGVTLGAAILLKQNLHLNKIGGERNANI